MALGPARPSCWGPYRGPFGWAGDAEPVGKGISELRVNYGPDYRVYYLQRGPVLVALLCGGDKSSQGRDIQQAKALAKQWKD